MTTVLLARGPAGERHPANRRAAARETWIHGMRILPLLNPEVVEVGPAVRLRPEAHLSRCREGGVFHFKKPLPVEAHREDVPLEGNAERIPRLLRNAVLHAVGLGRTAFRSQG